MCQVGKTGSKHINMVKTSPQCCEIVCPSLYISENGILFRAVLLCTKLQVLDILWKNCFDIQSQTLHSAELLHHANIYTKYSKTLRHTLTHPPTHTHACPYTVTTYYTTHTKIHTHTHIEAHACMYTHTHTLSETYLFDKEQPFGQWLKRASAADVKHQNHTLRTIQKPTYSTEDSEEQSLLQPQTCSLTAFRFSACKKVSTFFAKGKMEKTGCEIICSVLTTLTVKG